MDRLQQLLSSELFEVYAVSPADIAVHIETDDSRDMTPVGLRLADSLIIIDPTLPSNPLGYLEDTFPYSCLTPDLVELFIVEDISPLSYTIKEIELFGDTIHVAESVVL